MTDPYATLGVSRGACADTIRDAFRSLASEHHPDRGGDPSVMAAINVAYELLIDPERRKRFDTTGATNAPPSLDTQAVAMLSQAINSWIGQVDAAQDVLNWSRQCLANARAATADVLKKIDRNEPRLRRELTRIKRRAPGHDFITATLESELARFPAARAQFEAQLLAIKRAEEMLAEYGIEALATITGPYVGFIFS
jgi:curved DNA-binding protein CbpA